MNQSSSSLKRKFEGENNADQASVDLDLCDLTPWDRERPLRPLITDDSHRTTLQIRSLNAELTCPVCLGILRHTMTVMDCLHRFCDGCITRALRLGRKECPTCRLKCSTKRNLRPDAAIDGLVRRFYSDVEEFEKRQEEQIRSVNASLMKQSAENAMRRQAAAAARLLRSSAPPSPPQSSAASVPAAAQPPPPPPMPALVRKPRASPVVKLPPLKPAAPINDQGGARHATVPYSFVTRPPKPALDQSPTVSPDVALELRRYDARDASLSHPFLRVPRAATLGTLAKLIATRLETQTVEASSLNFYLTHEHGGGSKLEHTRLIGDLWAEDDTKHCLYYSTLDH